MFVALFNTFRKQNSEMVIFFLRCYRKDFEKRQFLEDGVWTVVYPDAEDK